jgi:hypothetical protein
VPGEPGDPGDPGVPAVPGVPGGHGKFITFDIRFLWDINSFFRSLENFLLAVSNSLLTH